MNIREDRRPTLASWPKRMYDWSEVPAPLDCVILEVLAKDGELMGYDAPLFRVREL